MQPLLMMMKSTTVARLLLLIVVGTISAPFAHTQLGMAVLLRLAREGGSAETDASDARSNRLLS
jgi:hypothetical protein